MEPARIIDGKPIYIVEDHASAVEGWWEIKQWLHCSPALLTLDHHTDTRWAFTKAMCVDHPGMEILTKSWEVSWDYCRAVDQSNGQSLHEGILRLKHDEHIDAAIKMGIIDHAYVISHNEGSPTRRKRGPSSAEMLEFLREHPPEELDKCPFTAFDLPGERIFEVLPACPPWCAADHHGGDECLRLRSDSAIESDFLDWKLEEVAEMSSCLGIRDITAEKFILDIDLDYFHTWKAVEPKDATTFYRLLRQACAITIATEPSCVLSCRLAGEHHTAESLLERVHAHLSAALCE